MAELEWWNVAIYKKYWNIDTVFRKCIIQRVFAISSAVGVSVRLLTRGNMDINFNSHLLVIDSATSGTPRSCWLDDLYCSDGNEW